MVDDEEMEMDEEDEDDGVNDNEDEAEVINVYEEVDPLNRPPSISNEETEFAPPVVPIADVDDVPIQAVIHFRHNFHIGEGLSAEALLAGNNEKMAKKFKEDKFRINGHEYDIIALDAAVRENRSDHSKMKKFVEGLSK
nr:hypothetical protein [Tanacetum cinerariifolium]